MVGKVIVCVGVYLVDGHLILDSIRHRFLGRRHAILSCQSLNLCLLLLGGLLLVLPIQVVLAFLREFLGLLLPLLVLLGGVACCCLGVLLQRTGVLVAVAQVLVNLFGSPVLVGVEVAVGAVAVVGVESLLAGDGVAHPEVAVGVHPGVSVEELQLLFGWRWGLVFVIVFVIVFVLWLASLQSFHLCQVGCVGARQGISSAGGTVDEGVHQAAGTAAQHASQSVAEQYGCHRADGANNCGCGGIGVLAQSQGVALA